MAGTFSGNLQGTPSRPLEMLTSSKAVTASYALTASKFDTASVGGPSQSIFISGGKPTPITASVGSKTQPIYVSGGKFTPADNIPTGKTGSWDNAAAWLAANSGSITGLTGSIPDVSAEVVLLVSKSASWDDAATWVGANSASISSSVGKVNNLKGITFQTGAFTAKTYHPTGSQQTVNVPSTAAHVGAVSTASFNTYTSSAAAAMDGYLPKTGGTITGSLTITQNLTVQGTTVSIDAQNLNVKDKLILVASGSTDRATANGAGIAVSTASAGEGGAARIQYESAGNRFTSSVNFAAPGFTGSLRGNVTGTASFATSASRAISASHADNADNAISASYATTSTSASYASRSTTASWAIDANHAVSASEALHASSATTALTASYVAGGATVTSASHAAEIQWNGVTNRPSFYSASFKTGSFSAKTYGPISGSQTINIPTEIAHINGLSAVSTSVKEMVSNTASWNGMANTASAAYISASHALATASVAKKEAESASYWKTEASKSAYRADSYADTASGSMEDARFYSSQAATNATLASTYAVQSSASAQLAAASASAAHTSANKAASSASKAANWAVSSSASANQAAYYAVSASASNTTIQQLAANVKQYYDNTTASAAQAATSATNAGNSATTATNAANRASASASVAKNWSTSASTYATNASASASLLYKNLGSATQPIYLTTGGPQLCDPYSSASVKNAVSASYATIAETVKGGATVTSASEAVHAISASHAVTASFALDHYTPSTTALTPTSSVGNSAARTYIKTLTLDKNKHVVGFTTGSETVTNTDTKVTAVGNHYKATNQISGSIGGTTKVVTGFTLDAAGHVTAASTVDYTQITVPTASYAESSKNATSASHVPFATFEQTNGVYLTASVGNTTKITAINSASEAVHAKSADSISVAAVNTNASLPLFFAAAATPANPGPVKYDTNLTYNASTNRMNVTHVSATGLTGSLRGNVTGTASFATSASRAISAASADSATSATSASYAANSTTASYALIAESVKDGAGLVVNTASYALDHYKPTTATGSAIGTTAARTYIKAINVDKNNHVISVTTGSETVTNTDTKVTAVGNHYTPTQSTGKAASAGSVISGLGLDAAGHVVAVTGSNSITSASFATNASQLGGKAANQYASASHTHGYATPAQVTASINSAAFLPITGGTVTGDLTVQGNAIFNGTASFINTTDIVVKDRLILLASGSANTASANGAGIAIQTASATSISGAESAAARLQYLSTGNKFTSSVRFEAPQIGATGFTGSLLGTASRAISASRADSAASATTSTTASYNKAGADALAWITANSSSALTNTDRYVNTAAFASTGSNGANGIKMTLTRAGADTASVTATIPVASTSAAGVVTGAQVTAWNGKQAAISDLDTIRTNAASGNVAFGWGNHASAGYVKSSGVTSVTLTTASNYVSVDNAAAITASGTRKIDLSAATKGKIESGSVAFGWGNHANAGYVKSSGVTSIATGTGLTGGPITSTGTMSIAAATLGKIESGSAAHTWVTANSTSALKNDATTYAGHYTPVATASNQITATITGSAGAFVTNTEYTVLTGIYALRDGKGHVTDVKYTAQKVKDTTVANTDRYVNSAAFASTGSAGANGVKMTLTRAGSDTATVVATIPVVSATAAGVVTGTQFKKWETGSNWVGANSASLATAITNNHTHTNKTVLDGITAAKTASWEASGALAKTAVQSSQTASMTVGSATTATKLAGTSGSTTTPVWINGGVPTACGGTVITDAERNSWVTASNIAAAANDGLTTKLVVDDQGGQSLQISVNPGEFYVVSENTNVQDLTIEILEDTETTYSPEATYGDGVSKKLHIWGGIFYISNGGSVTFTADMTNNFIWSENSVDVTEAGAYEFNIVQYSYGGPKYGIITKYSES